MIRLLIIIPARYGSTRFEGKPLVSICGRPMIAHVYERAKMSKYADLVIVATDDERILKAVKNFEGKTVMTSSSHETGTDRIIEVVKDIEAEWIINLQGDEPLIEPMVIDLLAGEMLASSQEKMFSIMRPVSDAAEFLDPNMVKVVTDHEGYALYFSRAPIPFSKHGLTHISDLFQGSQTRQEWINNTHIHCGIYGYRRDFLLSFPKMRPSFLEKAEGLEQLRILANGYRIKMLETDYRSIGVDTPEDIERVEGLMKQKGMHSES